MRMSCWPWVATLRRTIRSASGSSWRRSGTATRSSSRVDPRFNRTAAVADQFVQIRSGTDIAFLGGLINYALSRNRYPRGVRALFTNASFLVIEALRLRREARRLQRLGRRAQGYTDTSSWSYELDANGFAKVDPTLEHPRSVFQVMKTLLRALYARDGFVICGCSAEDFLSGGRSHHVHVHAGSRRDDHVRARMDALKPLGAAHSRGGDAAAAAGQHRPSRRRAECAARPRQHPGRHRLRDGVSQPARLHRRSRRPITRARDFLEAATPRRFVRASTNFWSNTAGSSSASSRPTTATPRRPPTIRLRLPSQAPADGRRAATRTGAGPTSSTTCIAARWRASSASA